jgi:hypothetical protein
VIPRWACPSCLLGGEAAKLTTAAVADHPCPRVGPARMQNSGPIGSWIRCSVQRATCSQGRVHIEERLLGSAIAA